MTSRVQLALNVTDLDQAVSFYEQLFQTPPAKREVGYANFAIVDPPLKLVLIENPEADSRLNHLGVEVFEPAEVTAAQERLAQHGLPVVAEHGVSCCYAVQDKVWVTDPDGAPWETYVILDHAGTMGACEDGCACG